MTPYYKISAPDFSQGPSGGFAQIGTPAGQAGYSTPYASSPGAGAGNFSKAGLAQGILGGASLIGNAIQTANQPLYLKEQEPLQYQGERPVYSGDAYNSARTAQIDQLDAGEVLGAGAQGAATGFAIGGPLGAGIGFVGGAALGIFAGESRQDQQLAQKTQAMNKSRAYQQSFNTASASADQTSIAQREYQRRLRRYNDFQNLYSTPNRY